MNWNIKPLQLEILKVFREFERICKKHNLRYYADGGTALGAVRHHGFIPWDDDLDVDMPREDYDKFIRLAKTELPNHLKLCRGGDTKYSPIHFSKIIDTRDGVIDDLRAKTGLDIDFPPFIDVFVLEGLPDSVLDIKKWWRGRRLLRLCQVYRYPESTTASGEKGRGFRKLMARIIGCFLSPFYPKTDSNEEMMLLQDAYARRWSFDASLMVVEPAFFKMRCKMILPKDVFDPAKELPFEDGTIMVPNNVDEYLKRSFGDYMTLPPPEYRIPEHTFKRAHNHV